jgi:hypothetical protein
LLQKDLVGYFNTTQDHKKNDRQAKGGFNTRDTAPREPVALRPLTKTSF